MDPAEVVKKICPGIRDGIIVWGIAPCSCGQTGQRVLIHYVSRGVRKHMRRPYKGYGFLDGHVAVADILGPYIADAMFAFHIVLGDALHSYRGVFKMFDLPLESIVACIVGIESHEGQQCDHNDHID